ncbi:MAG: hypothetical protein WAU58_05280 [Terriglobales bacterium]
MAIPISRSDSDVAPVIRNAGDKSSATANAPKTSTYATAAMPNLLMSTMPPQRNYPSPLVPLLSHAN